MTSYTSGTTPENEANNQLHRIGPLLGAAITAGYFRFVKYFNYEEANPGQDASHAPSEDDNGTPGDHQV